MSTYQKISRWKEVKTDMLDQIFLTDRTLSQYAQERGMSEEAVIDAMVLEGWDLGSDPEGWNQFWPPSQNLDTDATEK